MLNKIVISDLLSKACVITEMQAKSKIDVIEQLTQALCDEGVIDNKQGFIKDVWLVKPRVRLVLKTK